MRTKTLRTSIIAITMIIFISILCNISYAVKADEYSETNTTQKANTFSDEAIRVAKGIELTDSYPGITMDEMIKRYPFYSASNWKVINRDKNVYTVAATCDYDADKAGLIFLNEGVTVTIKYIFDIAINLSGDNDLSWNDMQLLVKDSNGIKLLSVNNGKLSNHNRNKILDSLHAKTIHDIF